MDREWESGIVKHAVTEKIWAGKTNMEGDGQADLKHHGGLEKAIFVYPISIMIIGKKYCKNQTS